MKPRNLRTLTLLAAIVIIAVIVLGLIPVDLGSKAAIDREDKSRFLKGIPAAENLDVRSRFSKASQAAQAIEIQKGAKKDSRRRAGITESMLKAKERLEREIPGLEVAFSDEIGAPEIVSIRSGQKMLAAKSGPSKEAVVRGFLSRNRDLYGLSLRQVGELRKTADYTNPAGNLSWVELRQEIRGLPVFQGELRAAFNAKGELFRTVGRLVLELDYAKISAEINLRKSLGKNRQQLAAHASPGKELTTSAAQAVSIAASSIGVTVDPESLVASEATGDGTSIVFEAGPFAQPTKAQLIYFPLGPGDVTLAWSLALWQDVPAYYTIVDAEGSEQVLWRKNVTEEQTQTASYSFYDNDSPAPLSPSNSIPGASVQGAAIGRTLLTLISEHLSNNTGWIPDGANTTTGNNVDAGLDLVSPNGIDPGSRPVGAPFRVFDFPYNPAPGIPPPGDSPTLVDYRNGEVVNMFVWSNRYHDRLYELGFTEAAGNFQLDNFGRGGVGNDFVRAEAQDFSGTNNANFATFADGILPRMQMYIFTGPTPDRTSALDHDVLLHELTHGTSNRLHANASGLATTMSGGMGEGWSDFYSRALLSTADEDVNGVYAAGGYVTLQIVAGFTDNYYYGIRRFPYAVKSNVGANGKPHNPLTFADIDPTQINLTDGAFPRGPIGSATAFQVHNIGEVWCMTLLEMRARLITRLGHAVGNQKALQLVTDGMKLDPASPTLVQGRDSILAANCATGTAADELDIWQGFATRGLGAGAIAASSSSSSVVENFDIPNLNPGAITVTADSCDNGGGADPGETVTLNVPLTNPYCLNPATGVTLDVTGGGSANYGDIAAGATVVRSISFTVPEEAACGSQLPIELTINSSLGPIVRIFNLQIGQPTGTLPAVNYSTGNVSIPLPDVAVTEVPIIVAATGAIADVNVSFRLNHTFDGDLAISLIAPDGTAVPLATNRGGAGDNFGSGTNDCAGTPTKFDDSAGTAISAGVAPFAATFRPETPLAAFNGRQMNGTWKLRVADTGALDVGTLGCVQLEISEQLYFCCGVDGDPLVEAAPPATLVAECGSNGAPDPGEVVTMSFPLRNVGTGLTTDLVATLQASGGVTPHSGPQNYGVMSPVGPAVSREFTFAVSGAAACGSDITATFALEDDGVSLGTVSFTIRVGATVTTVTNGANANAITIPGTGTGAASGSPANPYPSNINIAGVLGTVTKVTVSVTGFSHTFPGDVDMLLVGPGGQKFIVMSDSGGGTDAVNLNMTFDDTAATLLPATLVSGTFRPTNIGAVDPFPAPAPAAPYQSPATGGAATFASVFNGLNPNGTWSLYVVDDAGIDTGSISSGWSLSITTADPVCETFAAVSIDNVSVDKSSLSPPNHKMRDVTVNYDVVGCGICTLSVESDEPINGTGDGDAEPDWEVVDGHHVRLRAERAATGDGRVYTLTITCANGINTDTETVEVHVAHNITGPPSGSAFKINTPVNLAGTFWDVPGRTHTARWLFDGSLSATGTVVEPFGSRLGTARGTHTFTTPGVYKVSMNVTDNLGVTNSVGTIGDLEALIVIYDPSGGYTIGGGWVSTPAGSYRADPSRGGKLAFGFNSTYGKAANPKGETQINFTNGNLEFNALNYEYLSISGAKAQFKGFGKINGESGYNFILTVIDGQATNGGGVDCFRIKIWNKVTGTVVFDTQFGASDSADPSTFIGDGSSIIISK